MSASQHPSRRKAITSGITGLAATTLITGAYEIKADTSDIKGKNMGKVKVHYSDLLPHEFRKRLADLPLAYLPLGTLEWHGEHIALGADAIQSESLMAECAKEIGGIVMPPIHLGPDRAKLLDDGNCLHGMDYADVTTPNRQLDGSCYWISKALYMSIIDGILTQLKRTGFTSVFADGHGPSRWSWAEDLKERESRFGLKLFGVTEDIVKQWKSQVDHAAKNETSLMMHYRPELVDLTKLPSSRSVWPQGVGGEAPRTANVAYGAECMRISLDIMIEQFRKAGTI
ncbi:creatininase family protein [Candidatus Latescibacterota bacterium]